MWYLVHCLLVHAADILTLGFRSGEQNAIIKATEEFFNIINMYDFVEQ